MNDQRLTPEEFASLMLENKPYLIELEERVASVGFGRISVTMFVRGGVVDKMEFEETRAWLKDKALDSKGKS